MKMITLFVLAAALGAAQDRPSSPASVPSKPAASPAGIPKNAVEIEPNLYRYTDAHGKIWLARMTPFGVSTWEDKPAPAPVVEAKEVPPVVTDLGDSVRFQKKSPFGENTWVKKKADLSDEEREWLSRGDTKNSGGSSAAQSKPAQSSGEAAEKR